MKGQSHGFDTMRVVLSTAVILWHTVMVNYGLDAEKPFWTGPLRPAIYMIVPSFFAASGFLVAGSLLRNNFKAFGALRMARLLPALAFEVVLSALLIGTFFTVLPWGDYFTHPMFYAYLLNMIGWVHYNLPGVFEDLPHGNWINVQLWTMPVEIFCYAGLSLLAPFRNSRVPILILPFSIALILLLCTYKLLFVPDTIMDGRPSALFLVLCYLCGIGIYFWRYKIPQNFMMFVLSVILMSIFSYNYTFAHLGSLFLAYAIIYAGMTSIRIPGMHTLAQYSYGIYLYGFPVQQAVSALFPDHRHWWFNFAVSMPIIILCAYISWHAVEKPTMEWSRRFARRANGA